MWLNLSPGKVASQCCHAATKFGKFEIKRVILRVDSQAKLLDLIAKAEERSISVQSFRDSGPTTEGTDGVITVWSFLGYEARLDEVTGEMELY